MTLKDLAFVIAQVLLLLIFIAIPGGIASNFGIQLFAFILVISGTVLSSAAMIRLGPGLTPLPRPSEKSRLITSGIYKYIRHPIYTGLILIMIGITVNSLNIPKGIITVFLWVLLFYKTQYEEHLLLKRFPEYDSYKKRTGRFIPFLRKKSIRRNY